MKKQKNTSKNDTILKSYSKNNSRDIRSKSIKRKKSIVCLKKKSFDHLKTLKMKKRKSKGKKGRKSHSRYK